MRTLFLIFFIFLNIQIFSGGEEVRLEQEAENQVIVPQQGISQKAKGYWKSALAITDNLLMTDPSAQKSTKAVVASNFLQGILRKATEDTPLDVIVQNMSELKKFGPISEFLINFPISLSAAIKKADFNKRFFSISYQDDENIHDFIYDLQFRGSGNINDPIGYILLKNGAKSTYYYNPSKAVFMVKPLINEGEGTESQDNNMMVEQGKTEIIDLTDKNFNLVLKRIISLLTKGEAIYEGITSQYLLTPEKILFLKALVLINQAARNESSYPIYSHVPIEMSFLLERFSITPNFKKTNQNHSEDVTKSQYWDSDKIIYNKDTFEDIDNLIPDFLQTVLKNIKIYESKEDVLEYENQKDLKISQLDVLHSQMMLTSGYKNRTDFFIENILPINFIELNDYDKKIYLKLFYFHCADRYSGFLDFLEKYENSQIESSEKIKLDITLLTKATDLRIGALKNLFKKIKPVFSKNLDLLEQIENINRIEYSLDEEIIIVKDFVTAITENHLEVISALKNNIQPYLYVDKIYSVVNDFKLYILDLNQQDKDYILSLKEEGKKQINFLDYLKIKYYFFKKISDKRFRGDAQFIYQNYPLNIGEAINEGIAVILRANKDLERAGDLFKNDSTIYEMIDPNGEKIKISGKKLYEETIKDSQSLMIKSEQDLFKITSDTEATDFEEKYVKAIEKAEGLNFYLNSLDKDFRHYSMQYNFDRRDLSISGKNNSSFLKSKKIDFTVMNLDEAVKSILTEEEIFGQNSYVKFAAFKVKHKVQKMFEFLDKVKHLEQQSYSKIQTQQRNLEETIKTEQIFLQQIKQEQEFLNKLRNIRIEKENSNIGDEAQSEEEKKVFKMHEKSLSDFEIVKKIKLELIENKDYLEKFNESFVILKSYLESVKSKIEKINFDEITVSDEIQSEIESNLSSEYSSLNSLDSYFITNILNLSGDSFQEIIRFILELNLKQNDSKVLLNKTDDQIEFVQLAESTLQDYTDSFIALENEFLKISELPESTDKITQILHYLKFFKDKKMLTEYLNKGLDTDMKTFLEEKNIQVEIDSRKALENLKNLIANGNLAPEELTEERTIGVEGEVEKYDYARNVKQFLAEEFTSLMLRSDSFAKSAKFYFNFAMQNIFGMTFEKALSLNSNANSKSNSKLQEILELSSLYSDSEIMQEIAGSSDEIDVQINNQEDAYISIDEIEVEISDEKIEELSHQIRQDWNQAQIINKEDISNFAAAGSYVQVDDVDDQGERISISDSPTSENASMPQSYSDSPTSSAEDENASMLQLYADENTRRTSGYNSEYGLRR